MCRADPSAARCGDRACILEALREQLRRGSSGTLSRCYSDAITDVYGVEVGHTTLVEGEGKLVVGKGPVRTGVTAILPLGKINSNMPVPAAAYSFNGNGEMTGCAWVEESGFLGEPVLLTNTHSVGVVRDAVVEWGTRKFPETENFSLPVVLNNINGFHVKKEHVFH